MGTVKIEITSGYGPRAVEAQAKLRTADGAIGNRFRFLSRNGTGTPEKTPEEPVQ
jgi:hypothetical protein